MSKPKSAEKPLFIIHKKTIPIPPARNGRGDNDTGVTSAFAQLKPGGPPADFFVRDSETKEKAQSRVSNSVSSWKKRHSPEAKFTTRIVKGDEIVIRVWRTA